MNFIEIIEAKKEVQRLKANLPYFKNEARREKQVKMINTFIKLINAAERLVVGSYDKDMIDTLLLYVFKMEYEKAQYTDMEGFISEVKLNFIKHALAFDVTLGSDNCKEQMAAQMAVDMLANSSFISEEEKEIPVTESPKAVFILSDAKAFWKEQLTIMLDYCHVKKGVWKSS